MNIRYEQPSGKGYFSVIANNISGANYSLFLSQITRTSLRSNYLAFLLLSIMLPLLASDSDNEFLLYMGMVIPFLLPLNEADQTFSAESTYMDRLTTLSPRLPYEIMVIKYRSCIVWETVMLGYLLFLMPGEHTLFLISVFLFSAGPLFLVEFGSTIFNAKRWEIMRNPRAQMFNLYNIVTVFALLISVLVFLVISKIWSVNVASVVFICLGVSGILFHRVALYFIYNKFMQRRHLNLLKYRMLY